MNEAGSPPPGGKRERTKAENRAAILDAARNVFAAAGYEPATIRDVIRETGLAAGTFYNYFRDKESLLRALLDEKMVELQRRGREARRDATTVDDVVRRTVALSFEMLREDRPVFDILRRNAGAIRAILDEPSFVASRDELRRDLERALRRSGASRVDAAYLTAAISGSAFEVAAVAVDRSAQDLSEAADFVTRLVLGGIAGLVRAAKQPSRARREVGPRTATTLPSKPRRASAGAGRATRTARNRTTE